MPKSFVTSDFVFSKQVMTTHCHCQIVAGEAKFQLEFPVTSHDAMKDEKFG